MTGKAEGHPGPTYLIAFGGWMRILIKRTQEIRHDASFLEGDGCLGTGECHKRLQI